MHPALEPLPEMIPALTVPSIHTYLSGVAYWGALWTLKQTPSILSGQALFVRATLSYVNVPP